MIYNLNNKNNKDNWNKCVLSLSIPLAFYPENWSLSAKTSEILLEGRELS
jgi:hypothetical protein